MDEITKLLIAAANLRNPVPAKLPSAATGLLADLAAAGATQLAELVQKTLPDALLDNPVAAASTDILLDQLMAQAEVAPTAAKSLVRGTISKIAMNVLANATVPRPRPYSLWPGVQGSAPGQPGYISDYTSWPSLTRRDYSARHLPPGRVDYAAAGPDLAAITELFRRASPIKTHRSSAFFMFFAQWFTDSFMRVDRFNKRKNTSNHDIDLCQIYGLSEKKTRILRKPDASGELRSQWKIYADGSKEEFPDDLYEDDGAGGIRIKDDYKKLIDEDLLKDIYKGFGLDRFKKFYATGLERGNSSIGYSAISTIFLREHNRIARELSQIHAGELGWDGERIFQTARNINVVLLLKIIIEIYIGHVSGVKNLLVMEPGYAEGRDWYRTNWIAIEFNLLYRWHSLIPETIKIKGQVLDDSGYRCNNQILEDVGLAGLVSDISKEQAGRICLENSPGFMLPAEAAALQLARDVKLRSYNDYREQFGLQRLKSFYELTDNVPLQQKLIKLYNGDINKLEFVVGLYAEKAYKNTLFGKLMVTMVGCDAVTHAFTNPLLSKNVFNTKTFTQYGLDLIKNTNSLEDLVGRNVPASQQENVLVKFEI